MLSKPTRFTVSALFAATFLKLGLPLSAADAGEYLPGIKWEEPKVVTPGKTNDQPPSDAIVLFDGKNLDAWNNGEKWKIDDGVATVGKGEITTKQNFGDCQLHIEWSSPTNSGDAKGQARSNSGVFFGPYELQVLDSYENKTYFEGQAGAIYKQTPPWANAMRPPGEWNTYEIIWTAPKFKEDGSLESPAYITALHNGVVIQNHFKLQGDTPFVRPPAYQKHGKLPIRLQDHGNPVRFRNIWVREIKPPVGERVHPPSIKEGDKLVPVEESREESAASTIHNKNHNVPKGRVELREQSANRASIAGRITLDGEPISYGKLVFRDSDRYVANIPIDNQGKYDSKIKPGTYTVKVIGNDRIPAKFAEIETSGLKVQLKPGVNEIDFNLATN